MIRMYPKSNAVLNDAMERDYKTIPVVDLFAGPGGLGEGFSSARDEHGKGCFNITLSIEKEHYARETLELRAFFREFRDEVPDEYYSYLRGEITREELFGKYPKQAQAAQYQAWHAELGSKLFPPEMVDRRITDSLNGARNWVLIGGPPCQAYSVIGRSRMRGSNPEAFEKDPRHFLYREYLRILAIHMPPVFIMENVKGILSVKIDGDSIFSKILSDLRDPAKCLPDLMPVTVQSNTKYTYNLYSFSQPAWYLSGPSSFVVKMKNYGVPQDRHRVIILGIRADLDVHPDLPLKPTGITSLHKAIGDLPKLRSALSREKDSGKDWAKVVKSTAQSEWINDNKVSPELKAKIISYAKRVRRSLTTGNQYVQSSGKPKYVPEWYVDERLSGVCNHSSRSHIKTDIHRYFFASCFAMVYKHSPLLKDFPEGLLPEHKNARTAINNRNGLFSDRFRVQLRNNPATTITSHIAKDGHYFIHHDPV